MKGRAWSKEPIRMNYRKEKGGPLLGKAWFDDGWINTLSASLNFLFNATYTRNKVYPTPSTKFYSQTFHFD